jgi:predicted ATPase
LELLTVDRPFVLVLEDLHWSDGATLDWLTYIARRRDPAQLLVLGTYRPVETIVQAHPLRTVIQELKRHGQCRELLLDYLSEAGVTAYVRQRFRPSGLPDGFPQVLHHRTNGNPLFMIALVEDMMHQGVLEKSSQGWLLRDALDIVAMEVPDSLRQLIEDQLEHLSLEDLDILEAVSITGVDFSTAALTRVRTTGERTWEAELYRLKGELLLTDAAVLQTEVEACFTQALDIGRHQQAKSLELRAAMSLSRLCQQQGKRAQSRRLFAPIYGWFIEGFNTADHQEARALLDELQRSNLHDS